MWEMLRTVLLSALAVSVCAPDSHAEDLDKQIATCASIEDQLSRLRCYDELAKRPQPLPPMGSPDSELNSVKSQIERCWSLPAKASSMTEPVEITAKVGIDGRVLAARVTSTDRMRDPVYRAVAESALRAVLDPNCSPLKLPPEKYDQWKTLLLTFSVKDLQ